VSPSDQNDLPDDDVLEEQEDGPDANDPAAPVGSLTSLRIRRRAPATQKNALPDAAPAAARGQPEAAGPAAPDVAAIAQAGPRRPQDIVAYWRGLRGARRFPRTGDLDFGRIAADWPSTILLRCRSGSRALEPERVFSGAGDERPGLASLSRRNQVDLSPMMLQWLVGLAGEVVREGRPMDDVETFPSSRKSVEYRAVALPLSDDDAAIDHVLCHVTPVS
jgi:hypothetical protein